MAVTTEPVMIFIKDLDIIDEEIIRRVGEGITDRSRRSELITLRKELLHEIISRSKYARGRNK